MNQQAISSAGEIIKLLDHLRREVEESRNYASKGDVANALRNQGESVDELKTLLKKWEEFSKALAQR